MSSTTHTAVHALGTPAQVVDELLAVATLAGRSLDDALALVLTVVAGLYGEAIRAGEFLDADLYLARYNEVTRRQDERAAARASYEDRYRVAAVRYWSLPDVERITPHAADEMREVDEAARLAGHDLDVVTASETAYRQVRGLARG